MPAAVSRIIADEQHVARVDASARTVWQFQWSNVEEVAAWKYDLFAYDLICVGFRVKADAPYYQCCEEDQGWDGLLHAMEQKLGVRRSNWWERVALPAFRENWTILWKSTPGVSAGSDGLSVRGT